MISLKLKELRLQNQYTQKQIAELLKMSKTGYASWEQGLAEPNIEAIKKLAMIYSVTTDYLLELENEDGTKNIVNSFNNINNSNIKF